MAWYTVISVSADSCQEAYFVAGLSIERHYSIGGRAVPSSAEQGG